MYPWKVQLHMLSQRLQNDIDMHDIVHIGL